ncbi:MAG: tRNA (adenosine(37)-N6)-threonylcarbamoyltransferase complex dimerization subunit type 1 TsaB [Rhizomicrobium sp.]
MKLLAVDTALGACSAAILDGEHVLSHRLEVMERGHAERLAPMVQEAMQEAGLAFDALDRLAVTVGPGTFTGQRVGYAFMRGLRLALSRPLIGVTTLAAMARAARAETGAESAAVLHDAKRDEVYAMAVAGDETRLTEQLLRFDAAIEAIIAKIALSDGEIALAGTAAARAAESLRLRGVDARATNIAAPDALWVGRIAFAAPVPDSVPPPLYLRPPDARLPSQVP